MKVGLARVQEGRRGRSKKISRGVSLYTPVVIFERKRKNSWKEIEWSFDVIALLFEKG